MLAMSLKQIRQFSATGSLVICKQPLLMKWSSGWNVRIARVSYSAGFAAHLPLEGQLLLRPDEVLSGILDAPVLEVTHDPLGILLQHRHMSAGCVA